MGIKFKYVSFLILLALLAGCGAAHYEYPPYQPRSQAYGKTLPLRVAIPYPEEGLSAPDRDEDLEAVINASCRELPTYISQRLEISRGLLDELRATRAFAAVHWSPESLDDYDLIVKLKILSGGKRFDSSTCPALLGPYRWELSLLDQRGSLLRKQEFELAKVRLYSSSPAAEFRKDEAVFLGEITGVILNAAEELSRKVPDMADARAVVYMEQREPELKRLGERGTTDKQLGRAYLIRVSLLEAERLGEDRSTEALQPVYDQVWQDVQFALRGELKQLGEDVSRMLAQNLNMLVTVGRAVGVRPPRVLEVLTGARSEAARSVAGPDGARKLVDGISKRLLPGDLRKLAAESGVNEELAGRLRSALQGGSATYGVGQEGLSGCGKDTDCKGDRICVKGECVSPAVGKK
jgi:hypothetical protein